MNLKLLLLVRQYVLGLKEYCQTALFLLVTIVTLFGNRSWSIRIRDFFLFHIIFSVLVAGMLHCRQKLDEQFGSLGRGK